MTAERVQVLLPLPLSGAYDYRVPEGMSLAPGTFVVAPLGSQAVYGVVWGGAADSDVPETKLKDVIEALDAPPLPAVSRRFVDWVAGYTVYPAGAVLRMVMSVTDALEPTRPRLAYAAAERGADDDDGLKMTPARRRVLALLADGPPRPSAELAREAGVSQAVVRGLIDAGALLAVETRETFPEPDHARPGPALSPDQAGAAAELRARIGGGFSVTVLDGVTGSGKTEVYFEAIAAALAAGRQVLVLLPEIALGAQWLDRFAQRFGAAPAQWHSDLPHAVRRRTWRAVAEGEARIVVGARSALFLPFAELGLIVVDEEHDASYKQEDGVVYHGRDMAVVRANLGEIPAVLVSATPSLESAVNVEAGRYRELRLPARHGGASLPEISVIDLRRTPPARGHWLAPPLEQAVADTLAAGEQALLFLNRRGYAPLTLCRKCGHRFQCPNCTAWLVEHRLAARLECHHCGYRSALPRTCPSCGAEEMLAACGPGVERVAEEVRARFPDARLSIMASDTVHGPAAAAELIERIRAREIDIVVGTQIVAKGHHFPYLTLVGVVDADLGLTGGDLRAAERTFQLLCQVAGRAGRESRPGRALLQSYLPEHPVMHALVAGDREGFLALEKAARAEAGLPPFGKLAALIVTGRVADQVDAAARALGRAAPHEPGVEVLGPAPAPLATLRGRHRRRLLLKTPREANIQAVLRRWLGAVRVPAAVQIKVDVDPYSFL
jgi:primosomal protein N' (replication factor Y)